MTQSLVVHRTGRDEMLINMLVYPGMTMLDAIGPYEVLSRIPGVRLQFVASGSKAIRADTGFATLLPTCDLAASGKADVLVVPGGPPRNVMPVAQDPEICQWLLQQHEQSRYTASVCTGALILIAAGIVTEGEVSSHWAAADVIAGMGLTYNGKRITHRGKVFMAAGVSAGIDMALVLCAALTDADTARAIQVGIEYDPDPPFAYAGTNPAVRERALALVDPPAQA